MSDSPSDTHVNVDISPSSSVNHLKVISVMTNSEPRRKPVPPPKDETTLPKWVLAQYNKKLRRKPVSVASYTITISDASSDGESPSSPEDKTPFPPPVKLDIPSAFVVPSSLPLDPVPEDSRPTAPLTRPPMLAASRATIPLRRVKSLPPYGPGPTEMYVLPLGMKPSLPGVTRKSSMKKRWRPSPGTVRRTMVVIKKLEAIAEASVHPPPLENPPHFAKTFNSVKGVAFRRSSRRRDRPAGTGANQATVRRPTNPKTDSIENPEPPATYKSFVRQSRCNPNRPRKKVKISEWIDENLVFLPRPPQLPPKRNTPRPGTISEISPEQPSPTAATARRNTVQGDSKITMRLRKGGKFIGKAVVIGWTKAYAFGSSIGYVVVTKVSQKRYPPLENNSEEFHETREETVRRVMTEEPIVVAEGTQLADDASEISHGEDEILEAEPVQVARHDSKSVDEEST